MAFRFYLCGMAVISPAGPRPRTAPRVLLYAPAARWAMVYGGTGKGVCVCLADTTDEEHAAALGDAGIVAPPINPDAMDVPVGSIPAAWQTAVAAWLDARRIPRDWIVGSTTLRELLRYIIRLLEICRDGRLSGNYPEADLDLTVGSLSQAQRGALRDWATARGYDISDITASTTIRALVRALVERHPRFTQPQELVIAGTRFEI
jgi:hypothetical protein